ncbi:MAG: polyphenol oxidase family protein [Candidatus Kapabacteria bacterium]|nr:polyphenol oxidase family protein [Candidatus Kapabacteria bacterium]MCS7169989.1 polyphenol oxidase family protein [Candidatus Kapabacteria bacterium]MDW7996264.1 polyphenol oxidase family protein [Bacteroidota bacterium]MDW8225540.1 polyphenol oxidase family protein [Bacteroidota bacterium]
MLNALESAIPIEKPHIFPPTIVAGVTLRSPWLPTRHQDSGGASPIATPEVVLLAATLGVPWTRLKFQRQVHGAQVRWITPESPIEEGDGMLTSIPNLFLCIRIADCCAVLLACPEPPIVAALHAGWRGIAAGIIEAGIQELLRAGCAPETMRVYLSPCASANRYVVREDVATRFPESSVRISAEEYLLDLRGEIRRRLCRLGISAKNIESSSGCTLSDARYHSFRRDGAQAGRMLAFIGMCPKSQADSIASEARTE